MGERNDKEKRQANRGKARVFFQAGGTQMRSEVTAGNICGQGGWPLEEGRSPSKPGKRGDVAQKTKKPGTECSSEPGQKALCIFGATGPPVGGRGDARDPSSHNDSTGEGKGALLLDGGGVSPGKNDGNDCQKAHPPHKARIRSDHLVNVVHVGPLAQFKENSL